MSEFEYILAFLVGAIAAARVTRMVCFDSFPPMKWIRDKWDQKTALSGWNDLLHCPYCIAPYITAGLAAWGLLSEFHWSWWVFCSVASAAYLAAVVPASDWG